MVSSGGAQDRASTSKMAHSEGWLLVLGVAGSSDKALGVEGAWLGVEFPPHGPLQVTAWAFSLRGSWVPKGRKQKLP